MTKTELLYQANLALENDACLLLDAGDYFTDYLKIITPYTVANFIGEVEYFGTDLDDSPYEDPLVAIHSVDLIHGDTKERNEYYVRGAKAIMMEEVEALFDLVKL